MANLDHIEILTFDCYGTLIDWETGLKETIAELAGAHGLADDVPRLLTEWEAIQFAMIAGPYRRYRGILSDSLAETFRRRGVELAAGQAGLLAERLPSWRPFDDVHEVLSRLKRRFKLAILSNIDDDFLAASLKLIGVQFDELITAEQVCSYKPRPAHFAEALRRFGRPPEAFLHCAFGFKYDQRPALEIGMSSAWIKRPGWIRDDEATPTLEAASLRELEEVLSRIR
jgi:2-haloacid dehalogenase